MDQNIISLVQHNTDVYVLQMNYMTLHPYRDTLPYLKRHLRTGC